MGEWADSLWVMYSRALHFIILLSFFEILSPKSLVTKYMEKLWIGEIIKKILNLKKNKPNKQKLFDTPYLKGKVKNQWLLLARMVLPVTDCLKLEKSLDFLSLLLSCKTGGNNFTHITKVVLKPKIQKFNIFHIFNNWSSNIMKKIIQKKETSL